MPFPLPHLLPSSSPFHPGSTYKHIPSLSYWLNGQYMPDDYSVWLPSDFPLCRTTYRQFLTSADCPLDWAVWSIGPRYTPLSPSTIHRLPLDSTGWRTRPGHPGIIARIKPRDGASFSPLDPSSWPSCAGPWGFIPTVPRPKFGVSR